MRRLKELVGVNRRMVKRWTMWWRKVFTATSFWQIARGALCRGDYRRVG
jgi:hypothetical protein